MNIHRTFLPVTIVTLLVIQGCSSDETPSSASPPPADTPAPATSQPATGPKASAVLEAKSGSTVTGLVEIYENDDGTITFRAEVNNASPGPHAIHIHEAGDCSADDGTSAGGHWNPTEQPHGPAEGPHHMGDLGNIEVDATGHGIHKVLLSDVNLIPGDVMSCLGKAVIMHEKVDDFTTQPTGAAGARIACGVIRLNQ